MLEFTAKGDWIVWGLAEIIKTDNTSPSRLEMDMSGGAYCKALDRPSIPLSIRKQPSVVTHQNVNLESNCIFRGTAGEVKKELDVVLNLTHRDH